MYSLSKSLAAAGARRRRGGCRLLAAALAQRLFSVAIRVARAGHQLPVDYRVRLAPVFEARATDRRIGGTGAGGNISMSQALQDQSAEARTGVK